MTKQEIIQAFENKEDYVLYMDELSFTVGTETGDKELVKKINAYREAITRIASWDMAQHTNDFLMVVSAAIAAGVDSEEMKAIVETLTTEETIEEKIIRSLDSTPKSLRQVVRAIGRPTSKKGLLPTKSTYEVWGVLRRLADEKRIIKSRDESGRALFSV